MKRLGCVGRKALALAGLAMAWMGSAAAASMERDQLLVVVSDYVGVPAGDMQHALDIGRSNFLRAGVETNWRVCRRSQPPFEDCRLPQEDSYIQMNVVARMNLPSLGSPSSHLLGWAHQASASDGHPIAYAFPSVAKRAAEDVGQPLSTVLAWVMTHEVGHLLGLKHAPLGVMRAHPNSQSVKDVVKGLGFNPSQTKHLRNGVSRLSTAVMAAAK